VAMIMKNDESWVILSWTLVLNSTLSVFFIKSWTQSCVVFIMTLIVHGTFTVSDRVHIEWWSGNRSILIKVYGWGHSCWSLLSEHAFHGPPCLNS
jgi:hypothetical protein